MSSHIVGVIYIYPLRGTIGDTSAGPTEACGHGGVIHVDPLTRVSLRGARGVRRLSCRGRCGGVASSSLWSHGVSDDIAPPALRCRDLVAWVVAVAPSSLRSHGVSDGIAPRGAPLSGLGRMGGGVAPGSLWSHGVSDDAAPPALRLRAARCFAGDGDEVAPGGWRDGRVCQCCDVTDRFAPSRGTKRSKSAAYGRLPMRWR